LEIIDYFAGGIIQIWRKPLVLITNCLAWLLIFGITFLLFSRLLPLQHSLIISSFNIISLAVTYYLNIYLVEHFVERKKYVVYATLFVLLLLSVALLRQSFNYSYFTKYFQFSVLVKENWVYLFSVLTTLIVMGLSFFYGLLIIQSKREKEYQDVISRQQEAELQLLKAQMNPHFLFNTLNNIYSLTIGKAPKASEMLLLLSDLLRYAVYDSKSNRVSIKSEITQIEKLIQLYQLKSENQLAISFNKADTQADVSIEPMILIPLVENCFKHCNFDAMEVAHISIRLSTTQEMLSFETLNTKSDWAKPKDAVGGVGLNNIRQRLLIQYPHNHTFDIIEDGNTFHLKLTIQYNHG
jgi:two-component system, LytTR family, sensor kinase